MSRGDDVQIKQKKRSLKKFGIKLLAVGIIIVLATLLIDMRIRPIIMQISSYQCQTIATRIINQAVYDEINSELFSYDKLVVLSTNETGEIVSIESNMININKLKTAVTQQVNEALKAISKQQVNVAIGTLSGMQIFYGKGLTIPIVLTPGGYVNSKLISEFTNSGINQTLHRIVLEINVDISAIIPGYTSSVKVSTSFIIAETIIVGRVPEAYTHVINESADLIGEIVDYQAQQID